MARSIATWSVALLAAVVAVGASAAPSTHSDRTAKLNLIEGLTRGPQTLILGDSRGREAEPYLLQRLTGHSAFNASVTGGSTPDFWVFTRYTADLFPHQQRRYIWFVSEGLVANVLDAPAETDPRSQRYLREVAQYLSPDQLNVPLPMSTRYRADGSIAGAAPTYTPARAVKLRAEAAKLIALIRAHPPGPVQLDPPRFQLFEHLLAYANGLGARPVIVFNPIYPTLLAEQQKYGSPLLTSSLRYLDGLRGRFHFVVVNCEDSRKWGGTDYDWANPTHIDRANMRRMLRYVVAHSDGALK